MFSRKSKHPRNEPTETRPSPSNIHQAETALIEIDGRGAIYAIAFLADGKHVVSGGEEKKIRCWRVEDGKEVGTPMDAGATIRNIVVSQGGQWIVSGTDNGEVTLWNIESRQMVMRFQGHRSEVSTVAVDVSTDETRIATGSDADACVWSLTTGAQLLGPWRHKYHLAAVKFSPDGYLIAIATWEDIRIYDSRNGCLLFRVPIQVHWTQNQSLTWTSDSKRLFALSHNGIISCFDVSTSSILSKRNIHTSYDHGYIALATGGMFVAASAKKSVSFWDTKTRKQIGTVLQLKNDISSMAISENYDIAVSGDARITLRSLCNILPSSHCNNTVLEHTKMKEATFEETNKLLRAQEDSYERKIALLEETVQQLRVQLSGFQCTVNQEKDSLNETIMSLHARDKSSNNEILRLNENIRQLSVQLSDSQRAADQEMVGLHETIAFLRARNKDSNGEISHLKEASQQLRTQLSDCQQILHAYEQKYRCETLCTEGSIIEAAVVLLEFTNTITEKVAVNKLIMDWHPKFMEQCISRLEIFGDDASGAEKINERVSAYSTALSLSPSVPNTLLLKWTKTVLVHSTVDEILDAAVKFKLPRFIIYREVCDLLEEHGRVVEAAECFRRMQRELNEDMSINDERLQWKVGFQWRCTERLEKLGDVAMDCQSYNEAVQHFSAILSLDIVDCTRILTKRSKAGAKMNLWEQALRDADEAIKLDPSSYEGYERRHVALHGARRYAEATEAHYMMLSKLDESPDGHMHEIRRQYFDATPVIRRIVEQTIDHMPRVLINTTTGHLYDKKQQAEIFETLPVYVELISSMTTELDHARIRRVAKGFYRYVMLSHRWQLIEPTFQLLEDISVYQLPASPGNSKLQRFCELVRSLQFKWAWSDTCCINQLDKSVQQESLVAMFRWYHGSSLTIVHLLGVFSDSQEFGCLWRSIWNTRGWTYQEYIASEVVQFYTEDWKPYLDLDIFNHKESPIILSEMEGATKFATQKSVTLRPGLDRVREKLSLASMRQTTREEDIAYSLFGIFNVALPVIYGEGNQAVGRLLEHILMGTRDVTILAWTGTAGGYNSCLPADLTVYNEITPPHIPAPIETAEIECVMAELRSSLPDLSLLVTLYDQLHKAPPPTLAASRLRLPGIVFRLTALVHTSHLDPVMNLHVYHTLSPVFGDIEIKTADELSGTKNLCLVHPWIRPLLGYQEFSNGAGALDIHTQALRFLAHLKRPFGALLFEPVSWVEYRRVAADSLIMVRFREEVSLVTLMDEIRMIEIQ